MIPYGRQDIRPEDINAVIETLQSNFLTQGPKVKEFEENFANFVGSKYAVAVTNGTAALHLSALALGVNINSRVITTPITFAASANCVKYCGGNVYFADINAETLTLDINKVRQLIEQHPKGFFSGIIPVDFAGYPVNLEEFRKLADEHNLWIIEDACHAPGGFFIDEAGVKNHCGSGRYADLAIFSFHPVKHIACGEGGMITTNNENLYKKLLLLRTHGITKEPSQLIENHGEWYYEMQELGYNYRISDINSALGNSQLSRINDNLARRRQIAKRYYDAFNNNKNVKINTYLDNHAYHLYVIQIEDRFKLYNYLKELSIYSQVHYIPVHTLPYYQKNEHKPKKGSLQIAENYYYHCLSLPMYHSLLDEQLDLVINSILDFFKD